jgi:Spy/CpxP family protein refolding chaperone
MRVVSLIIALVALGAVGAVFALGNKQVEELENQVKLLESNLTQARAELASAREKLAKTDTSAMKKDLDELTQNFWTKVGSLGDKDAELEARIEKLASMPAPAAGPALAGGQANPDADPNADPDVQDVQRLMRGANKLFQGFRDRMFDGQMNKYKEQLNLSEAQAADMKKVFSEQMDKMAERMQKVFEGGGEDFDPRAEMEKFMAERNQMLGEILTPEQFEKFKELEQNEMQRWGGMMGGMRLPGGDRGQEQPGGGR